MLYKTIKEVYLLDAATTYAVPPPTHSRNVKEKSKQSLYRLGEAMRFTKGSGSQIQNNRHMKVVSLSALSTGRLYRLQEIFQYSFLLQKCTGLKEEATMI